MPITSEQIETATTQIDMSTIFQNARIAINNESWETQFQDYAWDIVFNAQKHATGQPVHRRRLEW